MTWERVAVTAVTVAFGLWLLVWALVLPTFQAPDETAHFDAAVHLAIGDSWSAPGDMHVLNATQAAAQQQATLPRREWSTMTELLAAAPGVSATVNQMTQHPPTAYLAGAGVLRAVHFGGLRFDHAVLALRIADAVTVTPLALLAWASVRRLTRSPRAALVGALALFATPQLASIGASVSNDAPAMLLAGLVVWLAVRMLTGDVRWRTAIGLGVALGAAIWVKGTALPAIPFVALVVLVAGGRALPVVHRLVRTVVVMGVAGGIGAWWWLHNLVAYHRLQPNGYAAMRPPKDFPPGEHPTLGHFVDVSWGTLARTFWGSPGIKAQVSIGDLFTAVLTLIALVVLVVFAFRRGPDLRAVLVLAVFPALLIGIQTYTSAHAYLTTTEVAATQGRYYFPGIVCLIAISAVAWRRVPRTDGGRRAVAVVLAVAGPLIGLYGLTVVTSWFWNAARVPLTSLGVERFGALGPVPAAVVGALVLLMLVGIAVTVTAVTRRDRVDVPAAQEGSPA
jgi:4-amino-4-deoxy-L-arabinose transferase-like glycosyltransferase